MNYISWRKSFILIALVALEFVPPLTSSLAASSRSDFCRRYAEDYSRRHSGTVAGAPRGRPSAMRGLQKRWLHSQAYKDCMNRNRP